MNANISWAASKASSAKISFAKQSCWIFGAVPKITIGSLSPSSANRRRWSFVVCGHSIWRAISCLVCGSFGSLVALDLYSICLFFFRLGNSIINSFLIFNMRSAESIFVNSLKFFNDSVFVFALAAWSFFLRLILCWSSGWAWLLCFFTRMLSSVTAVTAQPWTRFFQPCKLPPLWDGMNSISCSCFIITTNSVALRRYDTLYIRQFDTNGITTTLHNSVGKEQRVSQIIRGDVMRSLAEKLNIKIKCRYRWYDHVMTFFRDDITQISRHATSPCQMCVITWVLAEWCEG